MAKGTQLPIETHLAAEIALLGIFRRVVLASVEPRDGRPAGEKRKQGGKM